MTYFHLFYSAADYYGHIYREYRFVKHYLEPLVSELCTKLQYDLNAAEKKKVFRYYPLLTVCALAENYTLLKGRALTIKERKRITLMSAMATLCDDLIDEEGWTADQLADLFDILHSKLPYDTLSPKAKLIAAMNEEFKKLNIPGKYWHQLKKAFKGQADSIRQHQTSLSLEETIDIAREKNGNYCLTVSTLIDEAWTETEISIIYQHGMMGQLTNDIYDTYKDTQEGINTIVKKVDNVDHLRRIFMNEVRRMQDMILSLTISSKQKKKILSRYACMDAFTMIGIDTIAAAEHKYGLPMKWMEITRKDLVPDMARFINRKKYFKYVVWLSNLPFKSDRQSYPIKNRQ